jgi:hypothetical protein
MKRIKERFEGQVAKIFRPSNPGSAVCQGAVSLGFNGKTVLSRVARKTYGLRTRRKFEPGVDPEKYRWVSSSGVEYCRHRFKVFARAGSRIDVDAAVTHLLRNVECGEKNVGFALWSHPDENPRYCIREEGAVQESPNLVVDLPKDFDPNLRAKLSVTMHFGRSSIEAKAVGKNFGDGEKHEMVPIRVDSEWVDVKLL